jgi:predicted DNA-binding antitoxin AbrB/MazE fold protein
VLDGTQWEGNMSRIEAIYHDGVFKPLGDVGLRENQRVHLDFEPIDETDGAAWLEEVRQLHQQLVGQHGYFPDSTPDIAADRTRDE